MKRDVDDDTPPGYVPIMDRRQWLRTFAVFSAPIIGIVLVTVGLAVPTVLLFRTDATTLDRWSKIGEALSPIGVFFSGVAFIGIALTLFLQGRELRNQREELTIAREEQQRSSEIALHELHTNLIRMAIDDPELRQVWPQISSGTRVTKKDHYCNLILQSAEGRLRDPDDRAGRAARRAQLSDGEPGHLSVLAKGPGRAGRGDSGRRR
ncbi:DUF6082 family protein [Streptosporangium sp. CA-135522]|uniref:DUF6082 family protein n=1 Tax=Streptosporangium sp. CA-135522 TaxID=3240072 RepID=UPI003D8DA638